MIKVYVDNYTIIIILSTVGFFALAAILLVPIYRFLLKEEEVAERWTADAITANIERRLAEKRIPDEGKNLDGDVRS